MSHHISEQRAVYTASDLSAHERLILAEAEGILASRLRKDELVMNDPQAAGWYFRNRLTAAGREVFVCMFLDTQHRMIACEDMFYGSINGAEVSPRVIAKRALELNAAGVIVAHNHPSGITEPSAADRVVTERLKQALALFEIRVLDHFIIGAGEPYSFAAAGCL